MDKENKLGEKVKYLRKSKGFTQRQLAQLIGIDDKHVSKIENGVHLPTYKTLKKLSQILNFDLQNLEVTPSKANTVNVNPYYRKALRILNSAKSDEEFKNYYNVLKIASNLMNMHIM